MEQPIGNPWDVQSLEEFHFYCCPECEDKSFTKEQFINHALQIHPKSHETIPLLIQETGMEPEIGNDQLYFTLLQFCTLGGVANIEKNICHHKVTPVSLNLAEL